MTSIYRNDKRKLTPVSKNLSLNPHITTAIAIVDEIAIAARK